MRHNLKIFIAIEVLIIITSLSLYYNKNHFERNSFSQVGKDVKLLPTINEKQNIVNTLNGFSGYSYSDNTFDERAMPYQRLTKKDALDILFSYLYPNSDYMLDVTFCDTENLYGYEYKFELNCDVSNPWFLSYSGTSKDELYYIFCIGEHVYSLDGEYTHTHISNYFAVNRETKVIIRERGEAENNEKAEMNEEFYKILQ